MTLAHRITFDPRETVTDAIYRESGIVLGADKAYLIEARLRDVLARDDIKDMAGLARRLQSGDRRLLVEVVDKMTINESFFFRDQSPFDRLTELLPELARGRSINIWCAACAAGQEPYSLSMLLREQGLHGRILATDISASALDRAKRGVYSQFEVGRGLSEARLQRYFEPAPEGWRVRDSVREGIRFEEANLTKPQRRETFDLVLCRNVLIYFDPETRARVLRSLVDTMRTGAHLMLGGTETARDFDNRVTAAPDGLTLIRTA